MGFACDKEKKGKRERAFGHDFGALKQMNI